MLLKNLLLFFTLVISIHSNAIRCFTDYNVFFIPTQLNDAKSNGDISGPYLECYFELDAPTCKKYFIDKQYFIGARISMTISKENKIIGYKKINLIFPFGDGAQNYIGLERIPIVNGNLDIEIEILDLGDTTAAPQRLTDQIEVLHLDQGAFVSDIEWIGGYSVTQQENAFSKSGMDLIPHLSDVFQSEEKELNFYVELYNTDRYFGAEAFIYSFELKDKLGKPIAGTLRIKRETGRSVIPIIQSINLENLAKGEYMLHIEIKDKNNQVISEENRDFIRLNLDEQINGSVSTINSFASAYTDSLVLYEHIRSLQPISQNIEKSMIEGMKEYPLWRLQGFFYQFWYKRNPMSPEMAWRKYETEVIACQNEFGTKIKKGWETDRGRIYLQYGKPSTRVIRNNDPDYWPFEIWHFYQTNNNLHNKRFLFYNTSLNGDMELLHSDVNGEITNFDWKNMVRSRQMNDPATVSRIKNNQRQDPYSGDELESLWYNPH
jgi:GWxTD domain-containing protein